MTTIFLKGIRNSNVDEIVYLNVLFGDFKLLCLGTYITLYYFYFILYTDYTMTFQNFVFNIIMDVQSDL